MTLKDKVEIIYNLGVMFEVFSNNINTTQTKEINQFLEAKDQIQQILAQDYDFTDQIRWGMFQDEKGRPN